MEKICEMCGMEEATIIYTESVNGITARKQLCQKCADKMQIFGWKTFFGFSDFLKSTGLFSGGEIRSNSEQTVKRCECGMTKKELLQNCKFGCAKCYQTFSEVLSEFATKKHTGKVPSGCTTLNPYNLEQEKSQKTSKKESNVNFSGESRLQALKRELDTAVANQNFHRAAALQDEIIKMEAENGEAK